MSRHNQQRSGGQQQPPTIVPPQVRAPADAGAGAPQPGATASGEGQASPALAPEQASALYGEELAAEEARRRQEPEGDLFQKPGWKKFIADAQEELRATDLALIEANHSIGRNLNVYCGPPSVRLPRGEAVMKRAAEELKRSVSYLRRSRWFEHLAPDLKVFREANPEVNSLNKVRKWVDEQPKNETDVPAATTAADKEAERKFKQLLELLTYFEEKPDAAGMALESVTYRQAKGIVPKAQKLLDKVNFELFGDEPVKLPTPAEKPAEQPAEQPVTTPSETPAPQPATA